VFGNAIGLFTESGGTLYSYGNNSLNGNGTNGAFTGTLGMKQRQRRGVSIMHNSANAACRPAPTRAIRPLCLHQPMPSNHVGSNQVSSNQVSSNQTRRT
jgi:hypothetical protein